MSEIDARFTQIETRLDAIEQRLDTLIKQLEALVNAVKPSEPREPMSYGDTAFTRTRK